MNKGASLGSLELTEEKNGTIKKQLESSSDREKLDAMRKLVAVRSQFIPLTPAESRPHS
jgi:vesicle coat complex subunit